MTPMFEIESQAPEPFEIPELAEFYKFPFDKNKYGEYVPRKLQRNDPCVCGSGLKQKKCCGEFDSRRYRRLVDLFFEECFTKEKQNEINSKQEGISTKWLLHP